ncbi:uncharacterized protein LOC112589372 [Harpegnathos saltator]|uniref:uncharacterized protein LOC112589372 n=1 Tax=Harpegnathos saltator TaxID=610380 RepID=UPI000DBED797|nr:uncharacterized protein LOC112589372 [Harpegnathos saltator]
MADHVLVFMLRGLYMGWKMPISYNFCCKQTNTAQLVRCIKERVSKINDLGFHIVATVCDQGSSNMAAIKELLLRTDMKRKSSEGTQSQTFEVRQYVIVPLYDGPHLIKGVRNNLLTKDLAMSCENSVPAKIASWDIIKTAWIMDRETHKIRPQLKKIKYVVRHEDKDLKIEENEGLAESVNFFNDLFDSVNGSDKECVEDNDLRQAMSETSVHHVFWVSAKYYAK